MALSGSPAACVFGGSSAHGTQRLCRPCPSTIFSGLSAFALQRLTRSVCKLLSCFLLSGSPATCKRLTRYIVHRLTRNCVQLWNTYLSLSFWAAQNTGEGTLFGLPRSTSNRLTSASRIPEGDAVETAAPAAQEAVPARVAQWQPGEVLDLRLLERHPRLQPCGPPGGARSASCGARGAAPKALVDPAHTP